MNMSNSQSANHLLMIRPASFRLNEQTAVNNFYQMQNGLSLNEASESALSEFDALVELLRRNQVRVSVFDDTPFPEKPDCLFPNNWISFHEDDTTVLYPMFAPNRRLERRLDILHHLRPDGAIIDLSDWANSGKFLEGTGSLVLDRIHRTAYAAISQRTNVDLLKLWAEKMSYQVVRFHAFQDVAARRMPVYHTNVVLSIGTAAAIVGADSIDDIEERAQLLLSIESSGRVVVRISEEQVRNFAGNVLEVRNAVDEILFVMSSSAFHAFRPDQISVLEKFGVILHSPLNTIEALGGGSARCMLAEVFGN
jgi:hypothetical protein